MASPHTRPAWAPAQRPNERVRLVAVSAVCTALLAVVAILSLSLHRSAAHAAVGMPAAPYVHRALTHRIVAPSRSASFNARRYARSLGGSPVDSLPFAPDPADRAPRPGEVPSLYADGLYCSIGCRPYGAEIGWPLKPFHQQHPIRAGLNELRPASLHVGLDIQAPDGAAVYAVQPGTAQVLEPEGPNARVQVGNYIYWHIAPEITTGELVTPFQTVLGHVLSGYGHLAFSEINAAGQYVNPLRPEGTVLLPYVNHGPPVIGPPTISAGGQVIVPAYSPQTVIRRTSYVTPVLAPAALAYRLYNARGAPLTPLEWAFRGTHLLQWVDRSLIYAPGARAPGYGCFATREVCVPRWVYRLAGGFAPPLPALLTPGRYRLSIYAWDWADNATALDATVTMTPTGWRPLGQFPSALFRAPGFYTQSKLLPPVSSVPIVPTGRLPLLHEPIARYPASTQPG